MKQVQKYLDSRLDDIKKWISENRPFTYMNRKLGVARDTVREYVRKIDPSYKGNSSMKGYHSTRKKSILERMDTSSNCVKRIGLIEEGYKERRCEVCGLDEWMGKPIPLELHHKDFNHYNNELDNLMIVCSNCHMQLHGYSNSPKHGQNKTH